MKILGYEDVFNSQTWEEIQTQMAQLLCIGIRVVSEDGKVSIEHDSLKPVCYLFKDCEKNKKACKEFHDNYKASGNDVQLCPGMIYWYSMETEFFYKTFNLIITALSDRINDDFVRQLSADTGIDTATVKSVYSSLPSYSAEKIKGWANFIKIMFSKVMEPAMQTSIMYLAEKEKEEEINKLKNLMHSSAAINSTKDLHQLLRIIDESTEKLINAEKSIIFLADHDIGELYYNSAGTDRDSIVKTTHIKIGEGIMGTVVQTGISLIVNELDKEPRFIEAEQLNGLEIKSLICVPLKTSAGIIGVIKAVNQVDRSGFSSNDVAFLEALAAQASIAIENAIIYENMEDAAFKLNYQLKKANLNLELEKRMIESIIKNMEDAVIAINRNSRIIFLNKKAEKIFHLKAKDVINAPVEYHIKKSDIIGGFLKSVETKSTIKMEFVMPLSEEDHVFAAVFASIIDEEETFAGSVAVFRDITEVKKLDNLKTEFLNMIAHELRTPLTPIMAYTQLLLIKTLTEEKVKKYATLMFRETQRMGNMLNDLLDLSRIESGKGLIMNIIPTDLKQLAENVYTTFKDSSPKHTILLDAPENLLVNADRDKMTQVLINLLSNAMKYSPDGGEIKISLYDGDGNAYISVKDSGIGIPEDLIPNLFEKFYRVQDKKVNKIQGTGLGLTIVKKIMEYHKGGIKVESTEGKGSTFTVYMPK